ncbi:MAG TPA: NAD(P)H-hydrate dehydratase [Nocardioides sp.]|uniref:NAD(P)H-hydrate dehydratase n=1 Tax=Nocardioides sp. TaxID=35761 RepID=UPI002D802BE0|nr:NAD(P)H-hydrate dehydratase [Nocardioides sp.]HET6654423.1 NAD(P)H-hydrate dehydratase [Nocardioides sp.]
MPESRTVTSQLLREWALPRPGSDKEGRGVVLVVGGSRSTPGAVILASESALRVGSGKLQVATVESVASQVSVALPEALVRGFAETDAGDLGTEIGTGVVEMAEDTTTVLLGPGLLDPGAASALLAEIVPELTGPVVIDALGSAYVTDHPEGLHHLDGRCVLTLNMKELARTLGTETDEVEADQVGATTELARRTGSVVLSGGTGKVVASPGGDAFLVHDGGPGLGVSGSGDVQAGLVAGLLARGAEPDQAAVWGAALHGRAGDRLAGEIGVVGFLARELPLVVPGLLAELDR